MTHQITQHRIPPFKRAISLNCGDDLIVYEAHARLHLKLQSLIKRLHFEGMEQCLQYGCGLKIINADNTVKVGKKKAEEAVRCYSYQLLLSNLSTLRVAHNKCVCVCFQVHKSLFCCLYLSMKQLLNYTHFIRKVYFCSSR